MRTALTFLAPLTTLVLAAGLALPAQAQSAAPTAPTAPAAERLAASPSAAPGTPCDTARLSNLHRRLLGEAERGQGALLRYVHRTRMIHQLDPYESAQWAEAMRSGRGNCSALVAAAP